MPFLEIMKSIDLYAQPHFINLVVLLEDIHIFVLLEISNAPYYRYSGNHCEKKICEPNDFCSQKNILSTTRYMDPKMCAI